MLYAVSGLLEKQNQSTDCQVEIVSKSSFFIKKIVKKRREMPKLQKMHTVK